MGWVVGNAGLVGTILIILVAHVISVSTGLSISSISTDKKVGAGGVYYVLSRSLGLPIGGALGMTLFVATALSIALYKVGFSEIFNQFIGFGYDLNAAGELVPSDNFTNSLRITGTIGLLILTTIALISTSIALKTQFIILGLIVLSLFSIFLGSGQAAAPLAEGVGIGETAGFAAVFAIFFPAVTGFTAGVAMSGDLKDPKKSIPYGTMGAIAVGLIVYTILAVFIYYSMYGEDGSMLRGNPNALFEMAAVGILVILGVWGATLSSALGGILGGPRILQAMSVDKITPKLFAQGVGKGNEPRNALILTVIIAEAGVLIGDLNVIAEIVSMFYLAAYGFINLSFFLESWASSDFNPTFKVKKWIGLIGFIATFTIMSQLNLLAMVISVLIIGGIYLYLSRKQVALGTGDIWQSVWSSIVKTGLKRMEAVKDHKRNWKPNTLLFSTGDEYRTKMIEFSKAISGQTGLITNFDLIENEEATVLFPKSKEIVEDEELEKFGIFGRRLEVQNSFKGIESIACTFGFSGVEPNTALMAWPGQTENPIWFTQMTQKLMDLDYNVLYLDYDERWGFRKQEKIDLWWRGVSNNSELMLLLAKFIVSDPNWSHAGVRILLVNETNVDYKIIENRIQHVIDQYRIDAEIKIVNNELDRKPIYELMKIHSSEADLVLVGIPEIEEGKVESFVETTNNLVNTIGTTLLVKASSQFEETDLKIEHIDLKKEAERVEQAELISLNKCKDEEFNKVSQELDVQFNRIAQDLTTQSVERIEHYHHRIFSQLVDKMDTFLDGIEKDDSHEVLHEKLNIALGGVEDVLTDGIENQLPIVAKEFSKDVQLYIQHKEDFINHLPYTLKIQSVYDGDRQLKSVKRKVKFKTAVQRIWYSEGLIESFEQFREFGYQNIILLHQSKNLLHTIIWDFLNHIQNKKASIDILSELKKKLDEAMSEIDEDAMHLSATFYKRIRNKERENINQLNDIILEKRYMQVLHEKYTAVGPSAIKGIKKELLNFPSYWFRNINTFTTHLKGDIQLMKFSAKLQAFSDEAAAYTNTNYLRSLDANILHLTEVITSLEKALVAKNDSEILNTDVHLVEEVFLNSELVVANLVDSIDGALSDIPEEVELMNTQSINAIREHQGKEVKTEKVSLRDITDYLVTKEFEDPIHEQIQLLYEQLKRAIGKLINGTNILQQGLDSHATTNKYDGLSAALKNAQIEIEECKSQLTTAQDAFEIELRDRKEGLKKELDITQIIEQIETLTQYVKQRKRRKGVAESVKKFNQLIGSKVGQGLNYFVQKQQDITAIEYKQKYTRAISEQGRIADFVDVISPKTELPFYYQQLFTTTNFSDKRTIESRQAELDEISTALTRIDEGRPGAILILGSAGSGKSFLTTHVANFMVKGKTYHLHPPINKTRKKDDLLTAFRRATANREGLTNIMSSVPPKSTFVFQDLEQWWLKAKDGDVLINELAKIISKYGADHYFILNANIHSYNLISHVTHIQSAIGRSVVLAPLTPAQIRDAIWSRHKTGGLNAIVNGESEKHLSASKMNKFLNRFYSVSNGQIAIALNQWIASVDSKKDNDLILSSPKNTEFPAIQKIELKNLIYQLFIHYNLNKKEIYKLYGKENKNWIDRNLNVLTLAGLIEANEAEAYRIKTIAKPHIENWLNELGFIK